MIPILYEKDETAFTSNGLGRLRDIISCVCREERNGVYEVDFEYPVDGVNYDRIQCGRIIAVEHDESNDVQPFDIVGYSRPINGVVTFHAVHISYRQTALTVSGTNINSLADAFTLLGNAQPSNPFNYWTDKDSVGYMASGDGIPHSVRSILGGMEGSILDSYGGEYEWDTWTVKLWASRGSLKNFTIRYGVNLTDYQEDLDYSDTYTSVIPYWKGQDSDGNDLIIQGDIQSTSYPSFNGSGRCIPLDVTDKFNSEDGTPTKAQVEAQGMAHINEAQPYLPSQTIKVDFVRISDTPEYAQFKSLQTCKLCDSVNVMFSRYKIEGQFKIVKTEYDVLQERYLTMELGTLSITLSEALGITPESATKLNSSDMDDFVVDIGTDGIWTYRKWASGVAECWGRRGSTSYAMTSASGYAYYSYFTQALPSGLFTSVTSAIGGRCGGTSSQALISTNIFALNTAQIQCFIWQPASGTQNVDVAFNVKGTWK